MVFLFGITMIRVYETSAAGTMSWLPSPYKNFRAGASDLYYPTVTEMMYGQIPDIKLHHKQLVDFQDACTISRMELDPVDDKTVLRLKVVDQKTNYTYILLYHKVSSIIARLHDVT
jgi:hypothetical protein